MITLIAAIGEMNEIGYKNNLLWSIPSDMAHFKKYTIGKPVVMGRKTFESIGARPLPGRLNIVVTSAHYSITNVITTPTLESALKFSEDYDELIVIGGASIYEQTMHKADKLVITHVPGKYIADTFFPDISDDFKVVATERLSDTEAYVAYYERA